MNALEHCAFVGAMYQDNFLVRHIKVRKTLIMPSWKKTYIVCLCAEQHHYAHIEKPKISLNKTIIQIMQTYFKSKLSNLLRNTDLAGMSSGMICLN